MWWRYHAYRKAQSLWCHVNCEMLPQRHPELVSGSPCFQEIAGQARNDAIASSDC